MSKPFNPYRTPTSNIIPKVSNENTSSAYWAEGKYLVMPMEQSVLPHRCVRCNAPIDGLIKKRTLYWHHPALYLLIFLNILIYIIAALIIRKKIFVQPGLCEQHENQRIQRIYLSLSVFVASIFLLFISKTDITQSSLFFTIGMMGLLIGILLYIMMSKILSVQSIKGNLVYFSKCGQPFLDSLRHSNR